MTVLPTLPTGDELKDQLRQVPDGFKDDDDKRIIVGDLDITEDVACMYDAIVASMDWGSAFLDAEQCLSILIIGTIMSWEIAAPRIVIEGVNDGSLYEGYLQHMPDDIYRQRYEERETRIKDYWTGQVRAAVESGEMKLPAQLQERLGVALVQSGIDQERNGELKRANSTANEKQAVNKHHHAHIEIDLESMRRGGSCRTATCTCGWRGPERGTLELAVDDALLHERSDYQLVKGGKP